MNWKNNRGKKYLIETFKRIIFSIIIMLPAILMAIASINWINNAVLIVQGDIFLSIHMLIFQCGVPVIGYTIIAKFALDKLWAK